jgi:tRNA-uridine 2-sulfurtransferase
LHRAADLARDQSWFLFATTRAQLDLSLFPLGGMADKRAVRNVAQRLGLGVADKPDSQDICFVPSGGYADVVGRLRPDALEAGEIVTADGRVVGAHDGIARYTVGQGKRLGDAAVLAGERQVVVATDPARRRVVVGPRGIGTREVRLRDVNWLLTEPAGSLRCRVKLRARDEPRGAVVRVVDGVTEVVLDEPALPAPGQACVFYDGDRVLGGGIMVRA